MFAETEVRATHRCWFLQETYFFENIKGGSETQDSSVGKVIITPCIRQSGLKPIKDLWLVLLQLLSPLETLKAFTISQRTVTSLKPQENLNKSNF